MAVLDRRRPQVWSDTVVTVRRSDAVATFYAGFAGRGGRVVIVLSPARRHRGTYQ